MLDKQHQVLPKEQNPVHGKTPRDIRTAKGSSPEVNTDALFKPASHKNAVLCENYYYFPQRLPVFCLYWALPTYFDLCLRQQGFLTHLPYYLSLNLTYVSICFSCCKTTLFLDWLTCCHFVCKKHWVCAWRWAPWRTAMFTPARSHSHLPVCPRAQEKSEVSAWISGNLSPAMAELKPRAARICVTWENLLHADPQFLTPQFPSGSHRAYHSM